MKKNMNLAYAAVGDAQNLDPNDMITYDALTFPWCPTGMGLPNSKNICAGANGNGVGTDATILVCADPVPPEYVNGCKGPWIPTEERCVALQAGGIVASNTEMRATEEGAGFLLQDDWVAVQETALQKDLATQGLLKRKRSMTSVEGADDYYS